jgi:hypothetical protein
VLVNLTVKNLEGIRFSSSGQVKVGPLTTGDFDIFVSSSGSVQMDQIQAGNLTTNISSSGDVKIAGNANALRLNISSSGIFDGSDLQVQQAVVTLSSSGSATVWVTRSLSANTSSSGSVYYYGTPVVTQHTSSSGQVVSRGAK